MTKPAETADLVTLTEEIFNGKLHFLCSESCRNFIKKETLVQVFSCEFCEISKNTFFTQHLRVTAS